jgi:hypothetical protein
LEGQNAWQICHELVDNAPTLKLTDRYRITTERPIAKIATQALFPAIAIPVETKRVFECPPEHLDCLRAHLPNVKKILIVGWRGTEEHFMGLLKENLRADVEIQVVIASQQEAEGVLSRVEAAGIKAKGIPTAFGFTEYVVKRHAEAFFGS